MPDMTADAGGINYTHRDDNSRLLWQTQITKANPWGHRGTRTDEDDPAGPTAVTPAAGEAPPPTLIAQRDRLELHPTESSVQNPFESLLRNRLHVDLPGHEEDQP